MNRFIQRIIAAALGTGALIVLIVTVSGMSRAYIDMRNRTRDVKARVEVMDVKAKEDAANVPALEAMLEGLTQATIERESQLKVQTVVLTVSAVLFLICAKWLLLLGGRPVTSLSRIQADQVDPVRKGWRPWRRAKAQRNGQAAAAQREARLFEKAGLLKGIDLTFVDRVVAEEGRATEAAIPILQRIQSHYRYLPDEALGRVCELTEISPAQIAGVSTFYAQFRRSPVGRYIVKVCHGTACHVSGAREITDEVRRRLEIPPGEDTDPERMFTVDEVACLGCCSLAPVIMIEETTAGKLTPVSACQAIEAYRVEQCG